MGLYCKKCADEIWKTWNAIIGTEADSGTRMNPTVPTKPSAATKERNKREGKKIAA
jgi:hypothetical protein